MFYIDQESLKDYTSLMLKNIKAFDTPEDKLNGINEHDITSEFLKRILDSEVTPLIELTDDPEVARMSEGLKKKWYYIPVEILREKKEPLKVVQDKEEHNSSNSHIDSIKNFIKVHSQKGIISIIPILCGICFYSGTYFNSNTQISNASNIDKVQIKVLTQEEKDQERYLHIAKTLPGLYSEKNSYIQEIDSQIIPLEEEMKILYHKIYK